MYQHFLLIKKKVSINYPGYLKRRWDQEVLEATKGSSKCFDFYELVGKKNLVRTVSTSSLAYTVFHNQRIPVLIMIPSAN